MQIVTIPIADLKNVGGCPSYEKGKTSKVHVWKLKLRQLVGSWGRLCQHVNDWVWMDVFKLSGGEK